MFLFLKMSTHSKCSGINSVSRSSQTGYTGCTTHKSSALIMRLICFVVCSYLGFFLFCFFCFFLTLGKTWGSYLDFFLCFLTRGIMSCLNSSPTLLKKKQSEIKPKCHRSLTVALFITCVHWDQHHLQCF